MKILHVEDDPADGALAAARIKERFPEALIETVSDAASLERALEAGGFDLALAGHPVGFTDGLAVLAALRSRHARCPVVMLFGPVDERVAVEAVRLGASDYVFKTPADMVRLGGAILSALDRAAPATRNHREPELRALNRIFSSAEWSVEKKVRALLDEGCRLFGLSHGCLCRVRADRCDVVEARAPGGLPLAAELRAFAEARCLETMAGDRPAADGREDEDDGPEPARRAPREDASLGVRVTVAGRPFGALIFFSPGPSELPRDGAEGEILMLMARLVGAELERREAEQELKKSRLLLLEAQQVGHVGSWEWDVAADEVTWSEELYRLFGLEPGQFGRSYADFLSRVVPEDRPQVMEKVQEGLRTCEPQVYECRIRRPDGTTRVVLSRAEVVVDAAGRPMRMIGTGQDVTERRTADATRAKLAAFTRASPYPMLEFDREGHLTYHNAAAASITDALSATQKREALQSEIAAIVNQCLASGERNVGLETIVDGRILTWSFVPLVTEQVVHAYAVDITDRLDLETRLRHSQKMEAVGRLAGGMAHDFNNLLTVINGYCDFLIDAAGTESPMRPDLEEMRSAGERAVALTRQLLAFSRRQVLHPTLVDLGAQIGEVGMLLHRLLPENIEVIVKGGETPLSVTVDPGQMEQVIMNLALNARDAMPSGGSLIIETGREELSAADSLRHIGLAPGPYVTLSITDTGAGMDDATRAHLFEPFFTTKDRGKGTGLGLATVHGIVKQSGGDIWVDTAPGRGTTFVIFLPAAEGRTEAARAGGSRPAGARGTETILLVEDDETVRRIAVRTLESRGYKVLPAADGVEALDVAEMHPGRIDMLVTDVIMPRLGGHDLASRLEKRRPRMKVLYLSGYIDDETVRRAVLAPGRPFLQKPFTPAVLLRRIRDALDAPPPLAPVRGGGLARQ